MTDQAPVPVQIPIPTMEGIQAKYGWGRRQIATLRAEVETFFNDHPYDIGAKVDASTGDYVFYARHLPPLLGHWPMLIGDCLHNLRVILDYLVYQLAILSQGRDLTEQEAAGCSFPIVSDTTDWNRHASKIRLLRDGEQTRIRELQPFNALDSSIWGQWPHIPAGLPNVLSQLNLAENIDKHRQPHPVWYGAKTFQLHPPGVPEASVDLARLEDNAEFARWEKVDPMPELPSDMDVKRDYTLGVMFGHPPQFVDAADRLALFADAVNEVIETFRPSIERADPALPWHRPR